MSKRDVITHAAIQVFKEKGIERTKISDIVKEAGIAQGTFYLYFPSKLSLMPVIAEEMVEKLLTIVKNTVQDDVPFKKKLEQVVDAIFLVTHDYKEIHALIYSGLASTEHLKDWESVYEPLYKWMSDLLEEAKEANVIRQSVHTKRTAKLIIGLVESASEMTYLYDTNMEDQAAKQKAEVNDFLKHALGMNSE